jgi:DNA-binding transcriptional LysR family regulator
MKGETVELRHLRYFVAVADELHFRRAAERLHVAQPAVSEQIRKLEAELGVKLLNRNHRSVSLTDAGAAMLVEARRVLRQAEVAERVAKHTDARAAVRLRVGYALDCLPPPVARALRGFASSAPGIELALQAGTSPGLVEDVREGRLDVAVVPLPAPTHGLRATPLTREAGVAAVPLMHRFADRDQLEIEQLADSTLLVMPRTTSPAFFDGVLACCRGANFSPSLREGHEPRVESLLMEVALGHGLALLPASASDRYSLAGVRYVPMPQLSHEVALVAGPDPATAVAQLVKLARERTPAARPSASPAIAIAA